MGHGIDHLPTLDLARGDLIVVSWQGQEHQAEVLRSDPNGRAFTVTEAPFIGRPIGPGPVTFLSPTYVRHLSQAEDRSDLGQSPPLPPVVVIQRQAPAPKPAPELPQSAGLEALLAQYSLTADPSVRKRLRAKIRLAGGSVRSLGGE